MHNTMYGQNTFSVVSDALIRDRDWVHLAVTYNATTYSLNKSAFDSNYTTSLFLSHVFLSSHN